MADTINSILSTFATDQREMKRIFDLLEPDAAPQLVSPGSDRRALRLPLIVPMKAWITQPGGNRQGFSVYGRNVSQHGFSILHGRFCYVGSVIEVEAPLLCGEQRVFGGKVRFCRHIHGKVHEIGIQSDEMIDVKSMVKLKHSEAKRLSSMVSSKADLSGTCLLVDDLDLDRSLATHWLESVGVQVIAAHDAPSALKLIQSSFPDIAIVDLWLGDEHGADLVVKLKGTGFSGPIAAISASDDIDDQRKALEAGCEVFLQKPYEPRQLQDLAESLLLACSEGVGSIRSTLSGKQELEHLLKKYVTQLKQLGEKLGKAWERDERSNVAKVCLAIKGSGATYGFPQISEHAVALLSMLKHTEKQTRHWALDTQVKQFIALISRVAA